METAPQSQLGTPLIRSIREALAERDLDRAAELAEAFTIERETVPFHDFQRTKITALLSWIGRNYGDDELFEAQYASESSWYSHFYDDYWGSDGDGRRIRVDREFMADFVGLELVRGFDVLRVEEDEEKFTVHRVNAGGKMLREGYFDPDGRYRFYVVAGPQPMTFSAPSMNVYDSHVAIANQIIPLDRGGTLLGGGIHADPQTGVSVIMPYKDPAAIPEHFYERIGRTKPATPPLLDPPKPREFTDEELAELITPIELRTREAIARGDVDQAERVLAQASADWRVIHRIYNVWPLELVKWIRATHGDQEAYAAVHDALAAAIPPIIESLASLDAEQIAAALAVYCRVELCSFEPGGDAHFEVAGDGERIRMEIQPTPFTRNVEPVAISFGTDRLDALLSARDVLALLG